MSGVEEAIAEVLDDCWWTWRGSKDTAARLVAAVRVMSPTLVAELIDGQVEERIETKTPATAVDGYWTESRVVTSWRPLTPNTETRKT